MALIFARLFGDCPVCERSFQNHFGALLAQRSHDGSDAQKEFLAAFAARAWDKILGQFTHHSNEFLPLTLCAIRCTSGRMAVVVVCYTDVYVFDPEVFDYVVLNEEESARLAALIRPEQWIPFDGKGKRFWNRLKAKGAAVFTGKA
jgi:hypothetical protein